MCWSLNHQLCFEEKKNSPELGVGGSRSGTGVGVFLVELILFSSLFSIWALTHVAVAFTDACTSQQHADPSFGVSASRNLRRWGIWSIRVCAKGGKCGKPEGSAAGMSCAPSLRVFPLLFTTSKYNCKIIWQRQSDSVHCLQVFPLP